MNFKQLLFLALFFSVATAHSQSINYIDGNNVKALIADDGFFFQDRVNSNASYEYPKDSNRFVSFAMSYWMGGKDINGQLKLAANTYGSGGSDYFAGPIANDYNSSHYANNYTSAIWKINRDEINYHVANYTATGYTPTQAIADWPGNGDVSEGIAQQLAPYVDVNNDQIYNPMDGDHPYIQGDYAVYTIMNDAAGLHLESGGDPLGVEVHSMFYQYESNDELNNTTFLNVKVINRSTAVYNDYLFGLWMDSDIGDPANDFIGSDSTRDLTYGYNGAPADFGGIGHSAYNTEVPAFGFKSLNEPMHASVFYNNSGGPIMGDPSVPGDYYLFMNAQWLNGQHFTYGGNGTNPANPNTNYCYSGNPYTNTGWTEPNSGSIIGDRRMMSSYGPNTLTVGQEICYDFAFVVNNDSSNYLANVQNLLNTSDFVQGFFDNNIQPCGQIFLNQSGIEEQLELNIFPNPSSGIFSIQANVDFDYVLYDLNGKAILNDRGYEGTNTIDFQAEKGIYIIEIKTEHSIEYRKIEML